VNFRAKRERCGRPRGRLETVRAPAAGKKARRDEMDDEPPLVDSSPGEDAMNAPTTRTTVAAAGTGSLDPADPGPGRSLAMQLCVSQDREDP